MHRSLKKTTRKVFWREKHLQRERTGSVSQARLYNLALTSRTTRSNNQLNSNSVNILPCFCRDRTINGAPTPHRPVAMTPRRSSVIRLPP